MTHSNSFFSRLRSAVRRRPVATLFSIFAAGPLLSSSACSPTPANPQSQCPPGYTACGGYCVNTFEDPGNCGSCNSMCNQTAPFCSAGVCSATCGAGLTTCGAACADLASSSANCGACGTQCGVGETCQGGVCACASGTTCGGVNGAGGGGVVPGAGGGTGAGASSGGSAPSSGGATSGTGSTGAGAEGGGNGLLGGYHTHGDWAGFAFTFATDATISPASFESMVSMDGPYCVKGSVKATEEYGSIAAVGFNVSQPKTEDAEVKVLSASGDGLFIDIKVNSLTAPTASADPSLRIQLEDLTDPSSPDAADHRWCANIQATGDISTTIPWDSFNTQCWDGKGTAFDPATTMLAKVIIYAPDAGPMGQEQTFDFCVNGIGPDNVMSRGTGEIIAACPSNGTTWSNKGITGNYENIENGPYRFQSNLWNLANGGTSIDLIAGGGFKLTSQTCNTTTDAPCSFPSIYIGTSADGKKSSGFSPKPISQITSIPTCLGWNSGGTPATDEYNVSYDVWFNSNSGATEAEKFLMLWFRDPPSFQPGGMFPIQDGVLIGDQTWQVWKGPQHQNRDVISYVAPNKRADGMAYSFDLKDFIDDAVERGVLDPSMNLIAVMGGMEVWGGGQGASLTGFTAQVN